MPLRTGHTHEQLEQMYRGLMDSPARFISGASYTVAPSSSAMAWQPPADVVEGMPGYDTDLERLAEKATRIILVPVTGDLREHINRHKHFALAYFPEGHRRVYLWHMRSYGGGFHYQRYNLKAELIISDREVFVAHGQEEILATLDHQTEGRYK